MTSYQFDSANRLSSVDGVNYTFDANGNLLSDGTSTYTYDSANRLTSVNGTSLYAYNGLGDRLSQTVDGQVTNYTLDLNAGLAQILDDETNTYTYGLGRISQTSTTTEYFLGDALGSVRQLTNSTGEVTYAKSYDPYGVVTQSSGEGQSAYGYTGESQDVASGMVYLRSRYYNAADGRFQSRDTWGGDGKRPMSYNSWLYTYGNPINYTDPTGLITEENSEEASNIVNDLKTYNVSISIDWGYQYTNIFRTTQCGWNKGGWIMPDLKAIQAAVHIMNKGVSFLGGNFKPLIGKVVYVSKKGGNDGKGDIADNLADTHTGKTTWRMPNWYSEETRLWVAVHEMGHIVAFNEQPEMMDYYMGELGANWGRLVAINLLIE